MKKNLEDKRNVRFLLEGGYPPQVDVDAYLDRLALNISYGPIPHEIGLFLGYPLKDVLGYIGHPSLKLSKIKGWKVYRNPKISDTIYEGIEGAKRVIRDQLLPYEPDKVLLQFC